MATGAVQAELEHGGGSVWSVCFSPGDGARLASGGDDGRVKVWEVATGAVQAELEHGKPVWCVRFSPDGAMLAAEEAETWSWGQAKAGTGKWKVWDVATGAPVLPAPDTAAWQRDDGGGGGGGASQQAATAAFAVSVDGAAAVTVRPTGAADADALRFSPAETVSSNALHVNPDGTIAVARATMNVPPLILVPHGLDLLAPAPAGRSA